MVVYTRCKSERSGELKFLVRQKVHSKRLSNIQSYASKGVFTQTLRINLHKIQFQLVPLYYKIVGQFSDMFRPNLIGHPQGVLHDICSVPLNLYISSHIWLKLKL